MIPLGDSLASQRRPIVTQGLIIICVAVFLYELTLSGRGLDGFILRWGAVPRVIGAALTGDQGVPRTELMTLFTSQFLHAGFLHLGGNMLFLWVFGRAVEDRLGSAQYLLFYVLAGALAGLVQCFVSMGESVPLIGASGAIAAVLGRYFISYPTAWVRVLVPVLFLFWTFDLPAVLVLAFWFLSQFLSGMTAITHVSRATGEVAVWAHVAGFILGALSAWLIRGHEPSVRTRAAGGANLVRRADAPGPARLVSSVADLAGLVLAARLVLRFAGMLGARSPLSFVAQPILLVTEPVVDPLRLLVPDVRIFGGVFEIATFVAIVFIYLLAGLLGQIFVSSSAQSQTLSR